MVVVLSIHARFLAVILTVALLPLLLFALVVRDQTGGDLETQYSRRISDLVAALGQRLEARDQDLGDRLTILRAGAEVDPSLALALGGLRERASYPDEFVADACELSNLDLFLLISSDGTALAGEPLAIAQSCDRLFLQALDSLEGGPGLLPLADGVVWLRAEAVAVAGEMLTLVAGQMVNLESLEQWSDGVISASLVYHGGAISTDEDLLPRFEQAGRTQLSSPEGVVPTDRYLVNALPFPRFGDAGAGLHPTPPPLVHATLVLTHPLGEQRALLQSLDLRLASIAGAAVLLAVLAAALLSSRVTRPIRRLTERAEALDLDQLDPAFPAAGKDEVGRLTGVLESMRVRLSTSVDRVREAERRAVLGELARQVNHDVRNGFLPIRNVVWHLGRIAQDEPDKLPQIFKEREGTLTSGLQYLEDLAGSWKRLAGSIAPVPIDVAVEVRSALSGFPAEVSIKGESSTPTVLFDPTALRRIIQNLTRNALESLESDIGRVTVSIDVSGADVHIEVRDTGRGMDKSELAQIFDPYFTPRSEGTGLGLAIVRRLAADAGGDVTVESSPGIGSTFTLIIPIAGQETP